MEKQYPIILVFYLDRETMTRSEIIKPFADSINNLINVKKFNAIALFMPTDTEERVECINPVYTPTDEMEKINKLIEEIKTNFSVGGKLDDDISKQEW